MNSAVARCAALGAQQRNSDGGKRNEGATLGAIRASNSPMAGRELRGQLRAQRGRNSDLREAQLTSTESCAQSCGGAAGTEQAHDKANTERRRAKALAMLAEKPAWRRFVLVEAGEPSAIGLAIRGIGYGELELPALR